MKIIVLFYHYFFYRGAGHREVEAAAGRMIDVIGIGGAGIAEVEAGVGVGNVA